MSNGRLEKETIEYAKIEKKLEGLPHVLTDYYYTLRAEKKSYRTIGEYINSVNNFIEFIIGDNPSQTFYNDITTMDINKYMISLETTIKNGISVSTSSGFRSHRWKALNSFFEFLVDTNKIQVNPISKKSRPKITDNASVTYLTKDEIAGIINNIKYQAKDTLVNRDLSMFMLGVTTGIRVAAMMQINLEDIDWENGSIRVIEKMNKTYDIMIGRSVQSILKAWISDRDRYFKNVKTDALFISQQGNRISYRVIRDLLGKYAEGVTTKKITPHVMRHTCATNLYEATGDIYLTSAQLHHSSVNTTMRYADISTERLKKANTILDALV